MLLFEDDPTLAPQMLQRALGAELPRFARAEAVRATLTETVPVERRADVVIVLTDAEDNAVYAIIVEIQRQPDADKAFAWPEYLTRTRARYRCKTVVLVVATDADTAAWASRSIALDEWHEWTPRVLGPGTIPRVRDAEQVRAHPELGVLSAMMYRRDPGDAPLLMAVRDGLDASGWGGEMIGYWWDLIEAGIYPDARQALESIMRVPEGGHLPQSDWGRRFYAEGEAKGLASLRDTLRRLASTKGIELQPGDDARIQACQDMDSLSRWIVRASSATCAAELFESDA